MFRFDPGRTRWSVFTHLPGVPFGEGAEAAADYVFTIGDAVWIPAQDGVIRYDGNTWTRHRAADGLIDGLVSTVLKGKDGSLWVAGQHRGKSGAARFNGLSWTVYSEADGLVGENVYAGHAARNGDIWLGTKWGLWADASGVMRFDGKEWTAYSTDDGLAHDMVYVISQTSDGAIWIGTRNGLSRFDPSAGTGSSAWTTFTGGVELTGGKVRALCPTPNGDLWIGYGGRGQGVTRFDGTTWTHYRDGNGPDGSAVFEITRSNDGSLWFGTDTGISTYDGTSWNHYTRDQIPIAYLNFRTIAESDDGALWIRGLGEVLRLVPDRDPPETSIEVAVEQVSSIGNIVLTWSGHDVWNSTPATKLRYQYHLNDGPWSNWSAESDHTFTSLSSGHHTFEVRTADQGGNVDPTPAVHAFIVEAPWWRNPVVAGPGLLLIIGIVLQSVRVVKAKRKLQDSVDARSSANNELFQVNVDLQREQVLERLRGQAQGMQSSEDIGQVVENVFSELKALHSGVLTAGVTISRADGTLEVWRTQADGSVAEPLLGDGPLGFGQDSGRRVEEGEPYAHLTFEGEACRAEIQRLCKLGNPYWVTVPEERWPERKDVYSVSIPEGNVLIAAEESIPDETLMMVKRFGEVFGYAHSRWEELKVKEAQNRRLAVEASVQRLRAEVQSMDEASDFERILSLLTDSLKTVELTFDGCGIDVLDEPVEHPSMEHFEKVGFRYTAYRIDPRGTVSANSFHIPAPFPDVNQQTIERFIEDEPWQGMSEDQRIVEVPAGSYGRLRLTASDREPFTDDEVATLREFADAVALGYARFLDIREIQLNTERKSEFLASMSHELRTPMNAIKGFTNLLLRRGKDQAWERNEENLTKVSQASDHLLTMINDLLDLSKIEAGRMDVNPERFDVAELVSACDTVSPLIQEGVELRQNVADDIGEANTDKARLQQMVINLLSNAIKFTDSGSVTVTASRGQGAGSRERGRKPGHRGQ